MNTLKKILLTTALCLTTAPAWADTKANVEKALNTWLESVASHDPNRVAALYDPQSAVLLPTLSPEVHDTPEERLTYFKMFTAKPEIKGTLNETHIRAIDDNAGIASGIYTFTFKDDKGIEHSVPARFSFVFAREGDGENAKWLILDHHSSILPSNN
ncbi:MAG: SgcJ/EcaC family oxidoreductase [Proteobacteria bacterium]|nr:SgcJ/EcaC family oxidoreductase [Pseudomonadota bacterium]